MFLRLRDDSEGYAEAGLFPIKWEYSPNQHCRLGYTKLMLPVLQYADAVCSAPPRLSVVL